MGATSTLLFFDPAKHREEAMPILEAWVNGGAPSPSWLDVIARAPHDRDRTRVGERMLDGLRSLSELEVPRHELDEDTSVAIEALIVSVACSDGIAIGNALTLTFGVDEDWPGFDGLATPGMRAFARLDGAWARPLAHGSGGFSEGLHGALDLDACRVLADELAEAGFRSCAHDLESALTERVSGADPLRAAVVATQAMATLAVARGLGLLHGRDLSHKQIGEWTRGVFRRTR